MQVQEAVRAALIDWVHDVGIDVTKGQADELAKMVEEKFTSTNNARDEISLCGYSGDCGFKGDTGSCNWRHPFCKYRETSPVA